MSKLLLHSINSIRPTITKTITTTSTVLLKQPFKNDIQTLTQRVSTLRLTFSYFHTNSPFHKQQQELQEQQEQRPQLTWEEQQKNALAVERAKGIRSRSAWHKEEDALLLKLHDELGPKWSAISRRFVKRPPGHCFHRYMLLTDSFSRGPWTKEELAKLKELCGNRPFDSKEIDWEYVQQALPVPRPLSMIQHKYKGTLDPTIKLGRWTEEESEKLRRLVMKYGVDQMEYISSLMGNRTRRQCNERWTWQMCDIKKGRYSPEEDEAIKKAVEKYGENFAVVAEVTGIKRTARHISQHYRNILSPDVDRSPWSREEEERIYNAYIEADGNMVLAKKNTKSKRSIRDMWNRIAKVNRRMAKGQKVKQDATSAIKKE